MAFVNLSLVAGSLLIGVPIALHLLMRQRAKHALFPALQFLQSRREKNRRRLNRSNTIISRNVDQGCMVAK